MMVMDEIFSIKKHTRKVEAISERAKMELILALEARVYALKPQV